MATIQPLRMAAALGLLAVLLAAAPAGAATAGLDVYPSDVKLHTKLARQRVIVVATRDDGVTEDVTTKAKLALKDVKPARLEGGTLYPVADGPTLLVAEYDGKSASAPVTVTGAGADRPISFRLDVMPVFLRAGCNTGACHGAARGKDGFHLSLFGYDPSGDYFRLTRELGFRRINLALPQESLILQKATGSVPHTGGKRFDAQSQHYATLLRWLEAGAPDDQGEVPAVVEPADDVRVSNPPSNPELLETLGRKLVEYKYDFKRLVRDICSSNAYQRSTEPRSGNESDTRNFARARLRRIRAEVLLDCVTQVTETKDKFRGLPLPATTRTRPPTTWRWTPTRS